MGKTSRPAAPACSARFASSIAWAVNDALRPATIGITPGLVDRDAQDALALVGPQVRPLARVGVDRQRDRPLRQQPLQVAPIGGLVEPAVRVERDRRRPG